jgi:DNA (cytosine-5)-methyltransferase 1
VLRVADLFCGAGGFSHGFTQTGSFEVVLGLDIRPSSVETFKANHPNALTLCGDIRDTRVRTVAKSLGGRLDVVIGGPPCQGFSSIRPFRATNEDDRRNNLFKQFVVFVQHFRPKFVVFENVVGLLHHKRGQTLSAIQQSVEALGYKTHAEVLNAAHFGVPQKRERVVLIGRRGSRPPRFPQPTHYYDGRSMAGRRSATQLPLFSLDLQRAVTVADAIFDLPPVPAGGGATAYLADAPLSEYARARRKNAGSLTLHSSTAHTPRMLEIIRRAGTNRWALPDGMTTSGFSSCYSRLTADEPSTTITVNFVHPASNRCIHPVQDRALTPREGARLQSFDDDFEFRGSRTEIIKQIGEAVPPLLGRAIAEALLDQS